ncbi:zinc metalloprotease [Nocardiopsis sp. DSM 44743]|uniref:Zinc metalloprotease n=2 Tax=Nocardiopsis lambiniae TaxID=3075539 RepID=A0ABU2M4W4_9ACTN|nr:zinc metalloprotease [Nocardiopsis sp. DSM 44743]MDT0327652.1 zinc metalloprotease [Nocardiopsis sp. DSM 44743]
MIGRNARGTTAALWTGLVMCGLALTGTVASTLPDPTGSGPERTAVVTEPECPPGTVARLADPGAGAVPDSGELTPEQAARYHGELRAALRSLRSHEIAPPANTVPVVVHVISATDGRGHVSDARVDAQIDVLNTAYSGGYDEVGADTGFRFTLAEVTRTEDDAWFSDFSGHRDAIRARLRRGGPETLNIYTADLGSGLLGYSSFPQDYATAPERDGVVIAHDTLPGGDRERFDLGHTGTHEVGHWLGLFHTFQNGCLTPGDYVHDTPYEREAAAGCPKGRDSCPHRRGLDPVTNFMDYSDDDCMTHFTQGQARRMAEHWTAFRSPRDL